jgi:hypothetical protein
VVAAMAGQKFNAPDGEIKMDERTTICGSPQTFIGRCRRTASSTSSGRPRVRSARNRGPGTSKATRRRRTSPTRLMLARPAQGTA